MEVNKADETEKVETVPVVPPPSPPSASDEEEVSTVAATMEGAVEEDKEIQKNKEKQIWDDQMNTILDAVEKGIEAEKKQDKLGFTEVFAELFLAKLFFNDNITQTEVQQIIQEDLNVHVKKQMNEEVFNNLKQSANLFLKGIQKGYTSNYE
jgi:hypothetical protein